MCHSGQPWAGYGYRGGSSGGCSGGGGGASGGGVGGRSGKGALEEEGMMMVDHPEVMIRVTEVKWEDTAAEVVMDVGAEAVADTRRWTRRWTWRRSWANTL